MMLKRISLLILLLFFTQLYVAESYTVVLKNGKTMEGTLVSETGDTIVFRDQAGVQFSLKKASLDMEKMSAANAAAAQPAAPPEPVAPPEPPAQPPAPEKKKARVYTRDDLQTLRDKYGELTTSKPPIEETTDFENGKWRSEAYVQRIKDAAGRVTKLLPALSILTSSAATAWEVAQSTGKNPNEAVAAQLGTSSAKEVNASVTSELTALRELQSKMSVPPTGLNDGYQNLILMIETLAGYQQAINNFESLQNAALFRSRTQEISTQLTTTISQIQNWEPKLAPQTQQTVRPIEPPAPVTEGEQQTKPIDQQ